MDSPLGKILLATVIALFLALGGYILYKKVSSKAGTVQGDALALRGECVLLLDQQSLSESAIRTFLAKVDNISISVAASNVVVKETTKVVDKSERSPKAAGDALTDCVQQLRDRLPKVSE